MKTRLSLLLSFLLLAASFAFATAAAPAPSATGPVASADWSADMRRFAADDAAQPPVPGSVLFLGSSSMRLWTSVAQDFPGIPTVNRGFGGSQIADSLVHYEKIFGAHRPRLIVFYAGTNDLAAGKTAAEVAADFATFCARVHREMPETRIVFVSIQKAPARAAMHPQMDAANALVREFCAQDPRRGFLDVNPAVVDAAGKPRMELYSNDRLHMSPAGYAVWTQLLTPEVRGR